MIAGDPEFEAMCEAARVADFIEEREFGRWRTRHFEVTDDEYVRRMVGHQFSENNPDRAKMHQRREVPPGEYVTLQRRMTAEEMELVLIEHDLDPEEPASWRFLPEDRQWMPVMSDTPSEIMEHEHALLNATGRVLVTGLGLGCLPHALLARDDVTHIDIIEIDAEVIELTGAYFMDERVHIHRGSAANPWAIFPEGTRWDYAWHDIWTNISSGNLSDRTAEHGISYGRLFKLYAGSVPVQAAWAYEEAQRVLVMEQESKVREDEFERKLRAAPFPEQVEMVYERALRDRIGPALPADEPIPERFLSVLDPDGGLKAHIRKALANPSFWRDYEAARDSRKPRPVSRPNAHLEV